MNVTVDQVEKTLAGMWLERSPAGAAAHVSTVNIVAVCTVPDDLPRALGVISSLMPVQRGRAIILVMYAVSETSLSADVELALDTRRRGEACGEIITLDVRGEVAREWIPTTVERLLAPSVPTCLWWIGDLPDNDTLYDRLTETSDMVALHSADMDLRDLVTLSRLADWARGAYAMADLNWVRLRTWQESFARFFDDPVMVPRIKSVREIDVQFVPHGVGDLEEPASTQAALFAGWMLARMGARLRAARWDAPRGDVRTVFVPAADDSQIALRFMRVERDGVLPGAIVAIHARCDDGTRCSIERDPDDAHVLVWDGECADTVIPRQVMRVGYPEEFKMLARLLERPMRDPLFEASLSATAKFVSRLRGSATDFPEPVE